MICYNMCSSFVIAEEMGVSRDAAGSIDSGTNFADIISSALPPTPHDKAKEKSSDSSVSVFSSDGYFSL